MSKTIKMTTDQLKELLKAVSKYKYYYVYDSERNTDGQGEWHCDIWLDDDKNLDENDWGDGAECFSFEQLDNSKVEYLNIERDLPYIKTLGDYLNFIKQYSKTHKARLFIKDGGLWIRGELI